MPEESDQQVSEPAGEKTDSARAGVFDRQTLSDLFVNAVPIFIMGALLVAFSLLAPGSGGEPLLAMHLALIGGVLLVSYVAARAITGAESQLGGSREPAEQRD
ncbi:MAG: DUF6684 family protein [Haloarculaceae archaeon]